MKELLARYKYNGEERLQPLLADMLLPAFQQLAAGLRGAPRRAGLQQWL